MKTVVTYFVVGVGLFVILFVAHLVKIKSKNKHIIAFASSIILTLTIMVPIISTSQPTEQPTEQPSDTTTTSDTTVSSTQPTTKPTTTTETTIFTTEKAIHYNIEFDSTNNKCILVSEDIYIEDAKAEWYSNNESIVRCDEGKVILAGEGDAVISVAYEGENIDCKIKITVSAKHGEPYYLYEEKQGTNVVLLDKVTEYKYYRYVCNKCGDFDCYGRNAICKDSYPGASTCTGTFSILEEKWSEEKPETLEDNSFAGIKSIPPENGVGAEWYWYPEYWDTHNEKRTKYIYEDIIYYISAYAVV